jgi:hypothetical protein
MAGLLRSLKRQSIASVLVPDNWDNLTSKNSLGELPDAIVTLGPEVSKNLNSFLGIPMEICHAVGIPKFSTISPSEGSRSLLHPRILFLGFSLPYLEVTTLNGLYEQLSTRLGSGFTLDYKPHPNRKKRCVQEDTPKRGIRVISKSSQYVLPELDSDYQSLLTTYDVVICPPTTMLLEFALAGHSSVILDLSDDKFHRTTPSKFAKTWIHVRDLDPLKLPRGDGATELADETMKALKFPQVLGDRLSEVVTAEPSSYSASMANLVKNLAKVTRFRQED